MAIQKETVITTKKTTTSTAVTPKKPVKTPISKPLSNTNNSEKPSVRPPITTTPSKPIEKKSSDISNSTTSTSTSTAAAVVINKKTAETPPAKPPPVALGKIPKLNPANKQKPAEKPTSSNSLTDQKLNLLATGGNINNNNNKESNALEKNLSKRSSPQRPNRSQQNPLDSSDPLRQSSPMDLVDSTENSLGKQASTRYPSLLDNNPRFTSNFSRTNSIGPENTQSQSPLSPVMNIFSRK